MGRIIFWFVGAPCSGKSYLSSKLAKKLNVKLVQLDLIMDREKRDNADKEVAYKELLDTKDNVLILDGIIPFSKEEDYRIVKSILCKDKIIKVMIGQDYRTYKKNVARRLQSIKESETKILTEDEYNKIQEFYEGVLNDRFVEINQESDLDKITEEDIRSINYQHENFTEIKWKQLKVECKDKSVLDLGCSSCWFEKFSLESGANKYKGLDVNKAFLFNSNAELFDLNKLEDFKEQYDIVICSSVLHYIRDKETFIKEVSRITKEEFTLECPLSEKEGLLMELTLTRGLLFPTKELLEYWLKKYFKEVICIGKSIVEDSSYRLIFKCKK